MENTVDFKKTEVKCVKLLPALPLWIIEYAWSGRLTDLLNVLGPPLWLEGDWRSLTLAELCSVRAAAAEAWAILRARDVEQYERVIEFLEVTLNLLPRLVSCIKHMKIVFGFKTLVIIWMIRKDHCPVSTMEKTMKFFPSQLPQYSRCSRRHMDLMRKNSVEFREFVVSLARDKDSRQAYIRELMEEQYGEQYARKLEERLDHYLQELQSALPQPTCLDQVLRRQWPMTEGEELLLDLLASSSTSLPVTLKRLLQCALSIGSSSPNTTSLPCSQCSAHGNLSPVISPVTFRHSQQSTKPQLCCHNCCTGDRHRNFTQKQPSCSQEPQSASWTADSTPEIRLREEEGSENLDSPLLLEEQDSNELIWDHGRGGDGGGERGGAGGLRGDWKEDEMELEKTEGEELEKIEGDKGGEEEEEEEGVKRREREDVLRMEECEERVEVALVSGLRQMCSTHHKRMKSILLECSQELLTQGALVSLTPPLDPDTPILLPTRSPNQDPAPLPSLAPSPKEAAWSGGASPACVTRISAETQRLLIRSPLLQPSVVLRRLPLPHASMSGADKTRNQSEEEEEREEETGNQSEEEKGEEEEDGENGSFDVNSLFSDSSVESESNNSDSDFVP
ncbi:hypothetical protein AALO_G00156940 [Alosa alosa]|uniref:TERF1-interacting nuclear factor 2 N-terminal domain-containing protein n=1 Tax=Alosa alosa TaxID=278164 RepID=A0AAV6GJN6_9TELE|nr:hypothetical protein AALO_G00156940 [Alosa alosa]